MNEFWHYTAWLPSQWLKCFKHDVFLPETGRQIQPITKSIWNGFSFVRAAGVCRVFRSLWLTLPSTSRISFLRGSFPAVTVSRAQKRKMWFCKDYARTSLARPSKKQNLVIGSQTTQGQWEEKTLFSVMSHNGSVHQTLHMHSWSHLAPWNNRPLWINTTTH